MSNERLFEGADPVEEWRALQRRQGDLYAVMSYLQHVENRVGALEQWNLRQDDRDTQSRRRAWDLFKMAWPVIVVLLGLGVNAYIGKISTTSGSAPRPQQPVGAATEPPGR